MKFFVIIVAVALVYLGVYLCFFRSGKGPPPPPPPPELTMATFSLKPVPSTVPKALQTLTAQCTSGILIDWSTHELLWSRNPDKPVPIASMTKMMTALLLMEAMHKEHRVDMQTRVQVTPACAKIGGSQVWLDPKESFTIEELTKCVMVKSANDAAYLVGEYLAGGDYAAFVAQMNQRAVELGCSGMLFYNSHGLPPSHKSPENRATARELALLAARLLVYPDLLEICGRRMDYLRKDTPKPTELFNHNTLISKRPCAGVDGLKTGLTGGSGHCVTATCLRNGRRLIAVVNGAVDAKTRDKIASALLDWGYTLQAAKPLPSGAAPVVRSASSELPRPAGAPAPAPIPAPTSR